MDKLFITNDTVSTIVAQNDGSWILTIYFEKQTLHEKQYKTFAAAKAQETKLLKRYDLLKGKKFRYGQFNG